MDSSEKINSESEDAPVVETVFEEPISKTNAIKNEAGDVKKEETVSDEEIKELKGGLEQEYNKDAWNVLSRHYLEWTKSISSEDTENVKKYHRWSLPVNSLLRSKDLPENVTPEDKKSIRPIIKTLDGLIKNCPPVPVEFTAYRAVSSEMTLEEARALVGKSITPDNGFMSTAVNKPLAVNDFLQKDESKILYEITVPRGEKGIWMPAVTNFKESVSREGEFLLPRESRFIVTGAEEQWFINRRSRNAEDVKILLLLRPIP